MSTTTRRRWGSRFHNRCRDLVGEENGPKNNAAAAACCCLVWFPPSPQERERGGGTAPLISTPPPSLFPENRLSIRPTVVSFLHRSSSPSPLVVARPRSGAAQGRSASSSHGVGREFTGAVGGAGDVSMGWGGGVFGGVVVGTHLDEANVGGLLAEALTADVEAVLADETGLVGADAAVGGGIG